MSAMSTRRRPHVQVKVSVNDILRVNWVCIKNKKKHDMIEIDER